MGGSQSMVNALVKYAPDCSPATSTQWSACKLHWLRPIPPDGRCTVCTLNAILHHRGLRKYGGKIQLKSHVQEILLEGGRATGVRLRNGKTVRATKVGARSTAVHDGSLVLSCHAPGNCTSNAAQWQLVTHNLPEQAVVSNASMWDTLQLLPPGAVPDSYRQQVEQTPANRSFMHLHLGFDAAGILFCPARSLWGRGRGLYGRGQSSSLCSSR